MKKLLISLCAILFCATSAMAQTVERNDEIWYRLHLGTGIGDKAVSFELLKSFIDQEITTKFPDGFTIFDSRGQWKSPEHGLIRERTIVIDIQCPDTDDAKEKIDSIARAYVFRFKAAKASIYVKRISGVDTTLYY